MSLFQPSLKQTTMNRPSSSPWLAWASGNQTNILADELHGLLTLKDSVDSMCHNAISHNATSFLCMLKDSNFANSRDSSFFAGLEDGTKSLKYLGILSFSFFLVFLSVTVHCSLSTFQFSLRLPSRHSPVATTMAFQEYSNGGIFFFFGNIFLTQSSSKQLHNHFLKM